MIPATPASSIAITGAEAACCLGNDLQAVRERVMSGEPGLRPLRELDAETRWPELRAGWIPDRELMRSRRYGPASALAVHLARRAVAQRCWTPAQLADACVVAGSSRGNMAGWLAPWPGRKGRKIYAASNNLHGEIASAVSIDLGIHGGAHLLSNGCSSGLDALGLAWMLLRMGRVSRAVVVAVDLPLVEPLLASFDETSLLGGDSLNDPYSPLTTGFAPAEAGAVLLIEREDALGSETPVWARVAGCWSASDAYDIVGAPEDGAGLARCLEKARAELGGRPIAAICPHANGTASHARAEAAALGRAWAASASKPSLHLLKPFTGHSLGASGALEAALLADAMRHGLLPPNPHGLTAPLGGFALPERALPLPPGAIVLNVSVAMGGHNTVVALEGR